MTGAQALIESLKREQVAHIFGYAGATICPAVDALKSHPEIGYTLVRTEQNAGHMASGYARISGKVGVCMVTSGPGATNLITGIATAYMDSIPMVAITGQVPSNLLGRDIFQEVDITGAVAPFSKHSYLVKDANDIPRIVKEAFHIASTGRPGPVLIDIPIDVQEQSLKKFYYPEEVSIRGYKPSVKGNDLQIKRVVEAISRSKQPLICAGGGVWLADAKEELLELAERCSIPVVKTMMGLGLLPTDHPLNMGMIGAHGNHCANKALAKADLLIMVGTRAADRAMVDPGEIQRRMATIHIDVDPAEIGKNMQAAIPLVGNVKVILRQILDQLHLVGLALLLHELDGFLARQLKALELELFLADLAHLRLDLGEVLRREGERGEQVIIETVVDARADGELYLGPKALDGLRQHVGAGMPIGLAVLGIFKRELVFFVDLDFFGHCMLPPLFLEGAKKLHPRLYQG